MTEKLTASTMLTAREKLILSLSGEKVLLHIKGAEGVPIGATLLLSSDRSNIACFELTCRASIIGVAFKRIDVKTVHNAITLTVDLY